MYGAHGGKGLYDSVYNEASAAILGKVAACNQTTGDNVDFEKGAKRGAKKGGSRLSAAARKKISMAQKARWAKVKKAKAAKG